MIALPNLQRFLIYACVFFGPLGTLLSPSFMPYAFRFYHFLLLFFPLFFIHLKAHEWKMILAFTPLLFYCLISAYFTQCREGLNKDAYPLFRCLLFISQFLFMFGAAFALRNREQNEEKNRLIRLYLAGFFLSLVIGYIFYIGYYTHLFSFKTIAKYSVEAQIGWGLLRFSPGTYPNEYGNISSFVLSILLLIYAEKKRRRLLPVIVMTGVAFLLTTTRAAYLSFGVTLIYLSIASPQLRKFLLLFITSSLGVLLILKHYSIDFFKIFTAGVKTMSFNYGSTGKRMQALLSGLEDFDSHLLFGTGFGANMTIHNVYAELLFELGIVGSLMLIVTLFYYLSENSRQIKVLFLEKTIYQKIVMVGLIHIFLFAMTNHNMHHHLTWFIFLLFNMTLFSKQSDQEPKERFLPQRC